MYNCPNCRGVVGETALECATCGANFSAPGAWKPRKNGAAPECEPPTFFLFCFVPGVGFLVFLAYVALMATLGEMGVATAKSAIRMAFIFPMRELFFATIAGSLVSLLALDGARLPEDDWPNGILGWATGLLVMLLIAAGPFRFLTFWLVPYLLVPCVLLYSIGIGLVLLRLRRRRLELRDLTHSAK